MNDNYIVKPSQDIYNSFNDFIFSNDRLIFNKLAKKIEIYSIIKSLVGDIVEFGVFKGSGMALWMKLKNLYEPHSLMKIIGFDYFNPSNLLGELEGNNNKIMEYVVDRVDHTDLTIESVSERLSKINNDSYLLIQGDAVKECSNYYNENQGARIKLLYMDLDLGDPTYEILKILWNKVVNNGIIVFDEYGYHRFDESNGVDKFLNEIKGQYKIINSYVNAPSMYIIKIV
jgi:hypothetical protein